MRNERDYIKFPFVEKMVKTVRKELEGVVLDVGCGDGIVTYKHKKTIGIDILEKKYIKEHKIEYGFFPIPIVKGDAHCLPFNRCIFDTVLLSHILEHSDNSNIILSEVKRVLKPSGKIIVVSPNSHSLKSFMFSRMGINDKYAFVPEHKRFFTFTSLKKILENNGFKIEKEENTCLDISLFHKFSFIMRMFQKLGNLNKILSMDIILVGRNTN